MRSKRILIDGATYHVTSRANAKNQVFFNYFSRKIMLLVIQEAKEKYGFRLHNFCIMPNHIHLLITPKSGTNLSRILQWIKTKSAKIWNCTFRSKDHLWGDRFFSRPVKDLKDYFSVHNYIDQNPIKEGLFNNAEEWKYCGAYFIANESELVDYNNLERQKYIKYLPLPQ
jgi:putative transposase